MSEHILTHKQQTHKYQTHNHAASGWRIHCGVEITELSTNKQHTLSRTQSTRSCCLQPFPRPTQYNELETPATSLGLLSEDQHDARANETLQTFLQKTK